MIKVLVADDEPLAREELSRLINATPDFRVTAEAASGREVLQKIAQGGVDVTFLDIEMPRLTGLEVAGILSESERPPLVVFATAYDHYAIEAFEANAIDYILKPYEPARLQKTLERIRHALQTESSHAREKLISLDHYFAAQGKLLKIVGVRRNSKDRIVVNPSDVYYFYAHYAQVLARLKDSELIVNATLKELNAGLDPARFAQTHKGYIVNLERIAKLSPLFSGNYEITLEDANLPKVPLSRRYAKNLKTRLGIW